MRGIRRLKRCVDSISICNKVAYDCEIIWKNSVNLQDVRCTVTNRANDEKLRKIDNKIMFFILYENEWRCLYERQ